MLFDPGLEKFFAAQRDHFILWLPVFLGLGICAYFGLKTEPAGAGIAAVTGVAFLLWLAAWVGLCRTGEGMAYAVIFGLALTFVLGFGAAKIRTMSLAHPILQKEMRVTIVEGTIRRMELLEAGKGARVLLGDLRIDRLTPERTPDQVRITVRDDARLQPGQRIKVLAGLNPPPQPAVPGSFDFGRDAYFKNIGAFGYALKPPEIVAEMTHEHPLSQALERYRAMLGRKAAAEVSQPEASVVIALLNGDQRALPEETWDDVRIAGLAHIIAISGANISMAAGLAFFLSRFLMAMFPRFALYHPIKVYSAGVAFVAALAYALIVGLNVPTFRALVMTGLVLLAIAVNRSPFSLRMAGMSAFGLLLFYPEFLLGASFQLSFAAVVGLIVFYDLTRNFWTGLYRRSNWFGRIFIYLGGIIAVTILATVVTAPFSLANFQQFSTYGVIANAIVVPVVDFWIMPLAIIVYFTAPMGLEAWPLRGMEAGVRFMLDVAHEVAGWPQSQIHGAVWPAGALGLMVAGVLFAIIWNGRARWLGLLAVVPAMIMVMQHRPPDILVSSNGKLAMIRTEDDRALLSTRRSEKFIAGVWLKESGIDEADVAEWPKEGRIEAQGVDLACDSDACLAKVNGLRVAFSFQQRSLAQDCRSAAVVFSVNPVRRELCGAAMLADRWDLKDKGTHAVWVEGDKAILRTMAGERGVRPWTGDF